MMPERSLFAAVGGGILLSAARWIDAGSDPLSWALGTRAALVAIGVLVAPFFVAAMIDWYDVAPDPAGVVDDPRRVRHLRRARCWGTLLQQARSATITFVFVG